MLSVDSIYNELLEHGSDNLQRFGGNYEGGIHLQQDPKEFAELIVFLEDIKPMDSYLEIGSAAGGCIWAFNHYLNFKNIIVIDDGLHRKFKLREEILKGIERKEFLGDCHSQEAVDFVKSLGIMFDLIQMDADPTYNGMMTDIDRFTPYLNEKGILFIHGITESSCKEVKLVDNDLTNGYLGFKKIKSIITKPGRLGIGLYSR